MPELYVSQTPFFNAGAYGIDQPFIVLHSAAIELLDDDELRVLMSHELGHVISGHALYRTIAAILALISLGALPMLASLAVLPVRLAFLEWSRKSELSADRAGLLGAQDIVAAQRLDMKMAGGGRGEGFAGQLNVDAFMQQAHEYAASGEGLDVVYKVLSTLALTHPMHTVRAAELQRWVDERRLRPDPPRRVRPPRPRDHRASAARRPERRRQLLRGRGARARHPGGRRRQARRRAGARRLPERPEVVRLLVVGGGGREHALCWALRRENPDADLYCAPGQSRHRRARHQPPHRRRRSRPHRRRGRHARHRSHRHRPRGAAGPRAGRPPARRGARGVRTRARRPRRSRPRRRSPRRSWRPRASPPPRAAPSASSPPALAYVDRHAEPLVVKASGLAAGKGAVVCATRARGGRRGARRCWASGTFGEAGATVVIEAFLVGEEISVLALTDGREVELLPVSQDHKRLLEGDAGPEHRRHGRLQPGGDRDARPAGARAAGGPGPGA